MPPSDAAPGAPAPGGPLAGVRVLDLSRLVAGGMLGMQLADFGADVVKVEQPGRGDPLRTWTSEGHPLWWRVYARNKRAITLNLQSAEGKALLRRLVPRFDVLLESFVPGTLERWGLGPDTLREWHPGLIVARISAWGQDGPYRERPGFGTLVEAASGLAALTGDPDRPPVLPPFPLADMVGALYGVGAVMFALYARDARGAGGQTIDLPIFEGLFSILGPLAAEYAVTGQVRKRQGSRSHNAAPRGVYATADGAWIAISASTPVMTERFLRAYGLAALLDDPRFATNQARVRNTVALDELIAAQFAARTLAENVALIEREGLTAIAVQTIADIEADPRWRARGLTAEVADDAGAVRMHHVVPRLDRTPGAIRWPGKPPGTDNAAVYGDELGLNEQEIGRLRAAGVI
jgi:crotonobetainyl-CoA:carnitine CoA-transferase CaiB-like acyl-CoA transferase